MTMMRILKGVILGIILLLVGLVLAKDALVKFAVEEGVRIVTGLPLRMQSLHIGVLQHNVHIQGLQLHNPAGYPDPLMVDIPEIYVDYDLSSLLKGDIHLRKARLHLKEFVVVKRSDGELNLHSLKPIQQPAAKPAAKTAEKPAEKGQLPNIQIDHLELKVEKAVFKDYSQGQGPMVKEFYLDLDERFQNISDPNVLVRLIVFKALSRTTIGALANFDVKFLQSTLSDTLKTTQNIATEAVRATKGILQESANGIKDLIKIPFGH